MTERVPVPTGDGPHQITGRVIRVTQRQSVYDRYRPEIKATVADDRGFVVWGTVPRAAEVPQPGDRVTFLCSRIRAGDRDPSFGFYSRPRLWKPADEEAA